MWNNCYSICCSPLCVSGLFALCFLWRPRKQQWRWWTDDFYRHSLGKPKSKIMMREFFIFFRYIWEYVLQIHDILGVWRRTRGLGRAVKETNGTLGQRQRSHERCDMKRNEIFLDFIARGNEISISRDRDKSIRVDPNPRFQKKFRQVTFFIYTFEKKKKKFKFF